MQLIIFNKKIELLFHFIYGSGFGKYSILSFFSILANLIV
jgi:cell division protein FtsB